MTDLEKTKEFLTGLGVGFSDFERGPTKGLHYDIPYERVIKCQRGDARVYAHNDYYVEYIFDAQGSFVEISILSEE